MLLCNNEVRGRGSYSEYKLQLQSILESPSGTSSGLGGSRMGNLGLLGAQGILGIWSLEYNPSLAT